MIYLDCAATSLQKPPAVGREMLRAMGRAASPGRGGHGPAIAAAELTFACRTELAGLFGMSDPEQVVFTMNATHALNIAIASLVRPGTRVLVSGLEHNAVMRPLHALGAEILVAWAPLFDNDALLASFAQQIGRAEVVVCTQVSNVFGQILPLQEIAALCRERGRPLIIDASQGAGSVALDFPALGAAFAAMPGHKGLLGPQGTGVLLCSDTPAHPLLCGGTGSNSADMAMPDFLPDRLEAGTHNVTGIAGLLAGVRFVRQKGTDTILRHEQRLLHRMAGALAGLPDTELFVGDESSQAGVLSLRCGIDSTVLAEMLGSRGVAVRAGLHCAPLAHEMAGTMPAGTLRMSFSPFNTPAEVDAAAAVLRRIVKNM